MGRNTGEEHRIGAVVNRIQYYNPKTKMYVKMNTETNKIMSCSKNPYKGIRNGNKKDQDSDEDIKPIEQDTEYKQKNKPKTKP